MATPKRDQQEEGSFPSLALDSGVVGASTDGMGEADLVRGFSDPNKPPTARSPSIDDDGSDDQGGASGFHDSELPDLNSGFLGRPQGWER